MRLQRECITVLTSLYVMKKSNENNTKTAGLTAQARVYRVAQKVIASRRV